MSIEHWAGWQVREPPIKFPVDIADKRNRLAIQKRSKQETWVVQWINKEAPHLLSGPRDDGPSTDLVDRLLAEIDLAKGEKRRWRRNFLLRALNRGARELGWPSFPHQPILKLWLRGSPINASTFPYIKKFNALRNAFSDHWKAQGNQMPFVGPATSDAAGRNNLRQGQILLSAILYGGIASRARLAGVAKYALSRLDAYGDFTWVDWPENPNDADSSWQRWLPDQLTGLLLSKALADGIHGLLASDDTNTPEKRAWLAINHFLASLNLSKENRPTSLRMIFDWASAWHFLNLPPFLAAYAKEELESAALPPHVWQRHIQQRAIPSARPAALPVSTVVNILDEKPYRPTVTLDHDLDSAARKLRNILRGKRQENTSISEKSKQTAKQIRQSLSKFIDQEDNPPILQLLSTWVSSRISRGSPTQAAISVVLAQLESIDRLLIDAVGLDDILSYGADRLFDVYTTVIDASRSPKRHNLRVTALRDFQRYLERVHGICEIENSIFDELNDHGRVDANFFSTAHYQAALIKLAPESSRFSPPLAIMHQTALRLSFKTGLRRGEIYRLRIDDVRGDSHPVLLVRRRAGETLKSSNAVRVFPLSTLLKGDELTAFRDYLAGLRERYKQRSTEVSETIDEASVFLFPSEQDICIQTPEAGLFDPVEGALREVTGDPDIRLHHGRHGNINFLALHLLENVLPGCSAPFITAAEAADFEHLQEQLIGTRDPNRQHFWAVAILAGHGSPEITFGNYFHLCDWLLHFALRSHPVPHLDAKAVSEFLGYSHQKLNSIQKQLGISPANRIPIILSTLPSFQNRWPAERFLSQQGSAPDTSSDEALQQIGTTLKPAIPQKTAHSISTTQGYVLNACQLLNALNDLDSFFGQRASMGMKSKKATGSGLDLESIARRHQISPEQAKLLWKATLELTNILGKSGLRKNRLGCESAITESLLLGGVELTRPLPRARPVLNLKERDHVNAIFWQLELMWSSDPLQITRWLSLHWQHWREDRHALRFGHQSKCLAWISVICQLAACSGTGISLDRINLVHEPNGRAGKAPTEQQLARWITELALPSEMFVSGEALLKPKGETGDGILEISFPMQLQTTSAWMKQREKKNIVMERKRSISLALDAAAYVLTIEVAMCELSAGGGAGGGAKP